MPLTIESNISLKPYNTFKSDVAARYFCRITNEDQIEQLITAPEFKNERFMLLGEGSDVLFVNDFKGLIIKDELKGIDQVYETDEFVWLKVASGENWHQFVNYCVDHNWGGVENLALIPGTVGAAPVQNIGAYGMEVKDSLHSIEVFDFKTQKADILMNEELKFGYRWSIFKEEANKNRYYISSVTFKLRKVPVPVLHYADLEQKLSGKEKSIKNIFDTIIEIRQQKLPDPAEVPNAGSFFKNPLIGAEEKDTLIKSHPELKCFQTGDAYKLAAAQLIDLCGWKDIRKNNVGVFPNQALVICNFGDAQAKNIHAFAREIQQSVKDRFGIWLQPEVNIIES